MNKNKNEFGDRHFAAGVILWAVRWYLEFPISYRDLERMLADRGVSVDHTTVSRWTQHYAPEIDKRSWRVDETYIKVKGRWTYLYRAVDSRGKTIDFLLSGKRDAAAARRFFRKALKQSHTVRPRTITVDKNPAYPSASKSMKKAGELSRFARLRQVKYLTDVFDKTFSIPLGEIDSVFRMTPRDFHPDGVQRKRRAQRGQGGPKGLRASRTAWP